MADKQLPAIMPKLPRILSPAGTIGPGRYLLAGCSLMAVKFAIDSSFAHLVFHKDWTFLSYFVQSHSLAVIALNPVDRLFYESMVLLAVPFILIGVVLTMQRLRSAGLPVYWAGLFFLPFINLLTFIALCTFPTRVTEAKAISGTEGSAATARTDNALTSTTDRSTEPAKTNDLKPVQTVGSQPTSSEQVPAIVSEAAERNRDFLMSQLWTVPPALAVVWLATMTLQTYGFGLFLGVPFMVGLSASYLYGRRHTRTGTQCGVAAVCAVTLVGLGVFAFAWEGVICLLMAAPIAYALAYLGALLGYHMQKHQLQNIEELPLMIMLLCALPILTAAESMVKRTPDLICVTSIMDIQAPPAVVWQHVIAFPKLAPPSDPLFYTGIAYPVGATISGHGPGAIRRCNFSTGAFIEPIRVWDEPHKLQFGVIAQPPSMRERSWMKEIHPAHLEGYLKIKSGQFELLEMQAGNRTFTRLKGSTVYENQMWPASYWRIWSNYIIHRIHMRVLDHIKHNAELAPA